MGAANDDDGDGGGGDEARGESVRSRSGGASVRSATGSTSGAILQRRRCCRRFRRSRTTDPRAAAAAAANDNHRQAAAAAGGAPAAAKREEASDHDVGRVEMQIHVFRMPPPAGGIIKAERQRRENDLLLSVTRLVESLDAHPQEQPTNAIARESRSGGIHALVRTQRIFEIEGRHPRGDQRSGGRFLRRDIRRTW